MRRGERGRCQRGATLSEPAHLVTLEAFEALPWCPSCGEVEGLTTGWLGFDQEPSVLFCKGCGTPLVAL